ncbi:MAG: chromate resistance protein ChrB domain-containing protein [Betaproteobacteria bacterium]
MNASITPAELHARLVSSAPPIVIDVRKSPTFLGAPDLVRGALRRDPLRVAEWRKSLPGETDVVVYCVHGHEVSQNAAMALGARYLEGGLEAWREAGGALFGKPKGASSRWVTRERPKIDRIACPWLVKRFIDPDAEFLYVPTQDVRKIAAEREAVPYDVADVEFTHEGDFCSFDAFIARYRLKDPALDKLARIVRAADTGKLGLAPQAAGLLAVSLGLSLVFRNDHEMLEHGMTLYDALYRWCKEGKSEIHTWNPETYK